MRYVILNIMICKVFSHHCKGHVYNENCSLLFKKLGATDIYERHCEKMGLLPMQKTKAQVSCQ